MNWERNHLSLGEIKEKQKKRISFKALKDLDVHSVVAGCSCISPEYNPEKRELTLTYKAASISYHLAKIGKQTMYKTITVYYKDGTAEKLSFEITVTK